jgi:hypothetical protein
MAEMPARPAPTRAAPIALAIAIALAGCNGILGIQEGEPLLDAASSDTGPVGDGAIDTSVPADAAPDGSSSDGVSNGDDARDSSAPPDTSIDSSVPADATPDASPDVSPDTTPDTTPDTSTPVDAPADGACDQTALYPPRAGCPDHRWACWPAPATSPGAANYTVLTICGDVVVIDKTTGLMWAQAEETGTYDWTAAHGACTSSRRAGFSDWRLPTRIELTSLVDHGKATQPAIETSAFPSTNTGPFWSDSLWAPSTNNGWYVGYGHGYTNFAGISIKYYARCVR